MSADQRNRSYATLRFVGDHLDPGMISGALDLQPTFSIRKGEAYRHGRRDREHVGRTGVWALSSDSLVQSDQLHDHLDCLAGFLLAQPGRLEAAAKIGADSDVHVDIFCFWCGPPGAEPRIPDSFLGLVSQIGGVVDTDFYPDDEVLAQTAAE